MLRGFFFLLLFKKIMHFPVEFAFTGKSRFSGQTAGLKLFRPKAKTDRQSHAVQNTKRRSNS